MKEERKPEYGEKTPNNELQKMPYTKAGKCKPQTRLEPAHWHLWQVRKGDVSYTTRRPKDVRSLGVEAVPYLLCDLQEDETLDRPCWDPFGCKSVRLLVGWLLTSQQHADAFVRKKTKRTH